MGCCFSCLPISANVERLWQPLNINSISRKLMRGLTFFPAQDVFVRTQVRFICMGLIWVVQFRFRTRLGYFSCHREVFKATIFSQLGCVDRFRPVSGSREPIDLTTKFRDFVRS